MLNWWNQLAKKGNKQATLKRFFDIIPTMKTSEISQLNRQQIEALLAQQVEQNASLSEKISSLQQQLDWFKRQFFGRKSEKPLIDNPSQASLFGDSLADDSAQPTTTEVKTHRRKSNTQRDGNEVNDSGLRFDDSVPREVIEVPAPDLAEGDEIIDYKETCRLAQRPGSYVVLVYRRPVIKRKQEQTVIATSAPTAVLEGCYCDVSVLAGLMVDKAIYHLPLYRQHQRMLDSGVKVSRATLNNWIQKGIELLKPIYRAMLKNILRSKVLAMDEVPIKAGKAGKGKMKQTYFWPIYGEEDEVAFTWSSSRSSQHAIEQLTGFNGTLLTDGYPAYNKTVDTLNQQDQSIIHATCWVHVRRYFERALGLEPEQAQHAMNEIALLYKNEKYMRDKAWTAEKIQSYRQEKSEPVVHRFFKWVHEQRQRPELLPKNPLRVALEYAAEREMALKVFLSNPHVAPDTNHLERALRCIPMGRKNYLFCWSEIGAEQLGILQSLMVTCRMQGINPYHYLVDVLQRVSVHPNAQVEELIPSQWKNRFEGKFFKSDLEKMA